MRSRAIAMACLAVLLAVAGGVSPAAANSPFIDPADLPLDTLLELARQHAPKLKDARAKVALARLDVRGTEWWTWLVPSVTAHQGYDFLTARTAPPSASPSISRSSSALAPGMASGPGLASSRPSARSP